MKGEFEKTNLFSCPIYKIRIDPNSYDKEKILKDIKYNKSLKNRRNTKQSFKNCDIHYSYDDFDNEDFRCINYEKLISVYTKIFTTFFDKETSTLKQLKFGFEIVNYLAVTEGQWMPAHNHIEDDFASVHYLNFKNDHGSTCFQNPFIFSPYLKHIRPELYNILDKEDPDNSYLREFVNLKIKEDDMIIFPAVLNHEVEKIQGPTKEPRITIATNIWINL